MFFGTPCISGIKSIYPPVYLVFYPSIPLYIWYSIHLSSCLSSISRRYLEKICLSQQIFWFFSRLLQTILAEGNETQHQKLSVILTFIHLYIIYRELPSFMPFTNLFILQHRTRLFCIVHKNKLI